MTTWKTALASSALLLSLTAGAWAQRRVTGTVTDEAGAPLPGATVSVLGAKGLGASANAQGAYELRLPDGGAYTLVAKFVGYDDASATVAADAGQDAEVGFRLRESDNILYQVVVTGTRTPKLLKDAPIATRVISATDIRRTDATNIGDLIETELPGVEFSYSMNQQVSLNMSGFGGNSVLFLVDGERQAGETLDNVDYTRLNMDNVDRVEIVKGAASSLYGSNAIGGVVNIISREPSEPWSVNLNARRGAHDELRHGGSVGFRAGRVNSSTSVQRTQVDAINLARGARDEQVGDYSVVFGYKTLNVKERLVVRAAEGLRFTARAGYFFRERDASASQKDRYRGFSAGLKGNWEIGAADNLELSYSFDQYDKSDYLVASRLDVRDYSNVQHIARGLYNHTFAGRHILTVGGDYMRDYLMSYQFAGNGSHTQHTTDAFAQIDWTPVERLNVIGGVRFDHFSAARLSHVSPKVALMYKVGNCALRGSYAGGFRAPTLKEMHMDFFMGNIFMIYGNESLRPEASHNFSLSAEYLKRRHSLTVMGYFNIVDDRITTAWNQARRGMVYTNMARLQVAGVDANASGNYPNGISWRLSYAFAHEHIRRGQPSVSSTRPHSATARLAYDKDWKNYGLSVALMGRLLSRVKTDIYTELTSYERTAEQTYPGYTLWKLTLRQRVWRGITISTTADNIFNYRPKYYYSNSPTTIGTTFSAGVSLDIERMFKRQDT